MSASKASGNERATQSTAARGSGRNKPARAVRITYYYVLLTYICKSVCMVPAYVPDVRNGAVKCEKCFCVCL